MDDFPTLIFREPWLLKKISTSVVSTWLVGRELTLQGCRDLRQETKSTVLIQLDFYEEREGEWKGSVFTCTKDNFMWELQTILLTPLLNLWNWGVDDSLFWSAMILKKADAMHMLVTTWCTCPCGMVLMMQVSTTRFPIWWVSGCEGNHMQRRICVASRILTTKIPSALLVAITWLQHTWCPRFCRGTFGYGITTSPTR
jgi:hypothetical protein